MAAARTGHGATGRTLKHERTSRRADRVPIASRGAAMRIRIDRHARASHAPIRQARRNEVARVRRVGGHEDRGARSRKTAAEMVAHVVLFRLRADLPAGDATALLTAFARAVHEIPSVRSARVGRRVRVGAQYEQLPQPDFPYAAIIEFDDRAALQEYLNHPEHDDVAARFWSTLEATQVFDYELHTADANAQFTMHDSEL